MKKLLLLLTLIVCVSTTLEAQKNKIQTAWNYYKYDDLDKAVEAINDAANHESTNGMAKTWYYRGLIYHKTYKHEKFGSLEPNALVLAHESFKKALQIEPKYEFADEINQAMQVIANQLFGMGVDYFTAKEYPKALAAFQNVLKISPNDTLATLNAAYSAERADDKSGAKTYYNKLISMGYKEPKVYIFLGNIYKSENDTAMALSTVQKGRQLFPADNHLVIEELNIYLFSGKDQEALQSLNVAIQGDPTNANLNFARGTVYDKIGKKAEAASDYKKAIELKPDYFDAYYNLGAMYFNEGAEMANKANEIKSNTEYAKAKALFDSKFKEAMPFLEKAHELNPEDTNTMISLKQLYARLNETAKYEIINTKLKN